MGKVTCEDKGVKLFMKVAVWFIALLSMIQWFKFVFCVLEDEQKGIGIPTNILSRNIFIKVTNLGFKRQTLLPKIEGSDKDDAT